MLTMILDIIASTKNMCRYGDTSMGIRHMITNETLDTPSTMSQAAHDIGKLMGALKYHDACHVIHFSDSLTIEG